MHPNPLFDFSSFPVLVTERLRLRNFRRADAADVLTFRGDPIVQKYDDPPIHSEEQAREFIDELQAEYQDQRGISWAVALREPDVVIGAFGLHSYEPYHRRAEAGYGIAQTYWGQGYGTEALLEMLRFGFEALNLNRIYARTIADNHESVRMLERNGFTREGTFRRHSWEEDGTFHDSTMYGILRDEFPR